MNGDSSRNQRELWAMIEQAADCLYREARIDSKLSVYWEEQDVRGTAYALLTLHRFGQSRNSLLVQGATRWLREQLTEERSAGRYIGDSWEAQVWDTALGLAAFKRIKETTIEGVERYLEYVRGLNRWWTNWHDEVWETCFAASALLEAPISKDCSWLSGCLFWLRRQIRPSDDDPACASVQDSFHYTALYLRLLHSVSKLVRAGDLQGLAVEDYVIPTECVTFLLNGLRKDENLWTGEVWANSYCMMALVELEALPVEYESKCVQWFVRHMGSGGDFGSVEDTALAGEALYTLYAMREKRALRAEIAKGNHEKVIERAIMVHPSGDAGVAIDKELIIVPPRLRTTQPTGDIVFYFSTDTQERVRRIASIVFGVLIVGTVSFLAALFEVMSLWPI